MILYFHRNPKTLDVFYVGIGKSRERAYDFCSRNVLWRRYVNKYGKPVVDIINEDISNSDAQQLEIQYIKHYGRKNKGGDLCNISTGGETGDRLINYLISNPEKNPMFKEVNKAKITGNNNPMRNPEVLLKYSIARKGKRLSAQAKINISIAAKKRKYTPEGLEKLKLRMVELNKSDINRERKKLLMTGNNYRSLWVLSAEQKEKQANLLREISSRPDVKEKIRKANTGKDKLNSRVAIIMIDVITDEVLNRFDGLVSAAKYLGVHRWAPSISSVLSGKNKTAYGYKWQYAT